MRFVRFVAMGSVLFALAGCASTTNPAMLTALAPVSETPVPTECDATSCKAQWERAQLWMAKHARMKIQTATDVQIATFNPSEEYMWGFAALKEPADSGRYRITLTPICRTALPPCSPKSIDVLRAFYHYVGTGRDVLDGLEFKGMQMGIRE